jgi:hypothetical protein
VDTHALDLGGWHAFTHEQLSSPRPLSRPVATTWCRGDWCLTRFHTSVHKSRRVLDLPRPAASRCSNGAAVASSCPSFDGGSGDGSRSWRPALPGLRPQVGRTVVLPPCHRGDTNSAVSVRDVIVHVHDVWLFRAARSTRPETCRRSLQ